MFLKIAGGFIQVSNKIIGKSEDQVKNLQLRQKKILGLRWKNFQRENPSQKLAASLFNLYDESVAKLTGFCGENAPISETDSELWDLYYDSFENKALVDFNVTRKDALLRLKIELEG